MKNFLTLFCSQINPFDPNKCASYQFEIMTTLAPFARQHAMFGKDLKQWINFMCPNETSKKKMNWTLLWYYCYPRIKMKDCTNKLLMNNVYDYTLNLVCREIRNNYHSQYKWPYTPTSFTREKIDIICDECGIDYTESFMICTQLVTGKSWTARGHLNTHYFCGTNCKWSYRKL